MFVCLLFYGPSPLCVIYIIVVYTSMPTDGFPCPFFRLNKFSMLERSKSLPYRHHLKYILSFSYTPSVCFSLFLLVFSRVSLQYTHTHRQGQTSLFKRQRTGIYLFLLISFSFFFFSPLFVRCSG